MIGKYLYQFVYVFYYKHDLWHKGSVFLAIRTLLHCKYSACIRFMSVLAQLRCSEIVDYQVYCENVPVL